MNEWATESPKHESHYTTVIASTIYYSHTYNLPITYMKYLGDIDTLTQ